MRPVKPEWITLQAHFTSLHLTERCSCITQELDELKQQLEDDLSDRSEMDFRLRKIQRYVEWTVPDLVPQRAEAAEQLANVSRLAARLLVHPDPGHKHLIVEEVEQRIQQVRIMHTAN